MSHKWLTFLTAGFLTVIVMVFFWYRLQPIELDREEIMASFEEVTEPSITFINPSLGSDTARITIIEYSDFQCHACGELAENLVSVITAFPTDVRIIWKDLPNESIHPQATPAAIAAHCADRQDAFWAYHDELFNRQTFLSDSTFSQIATDLELDVEKFDNCYNTRDTLPIVKKDFEEAMGLGLTATPTMYINDEIYVGAFQSDEIINIVTEQLAAFQ